MNSFRIHLLLFLLAVVTVVLAVKFYAFVCLKRHENGTKGSIKNNNSVSRLYAKLLIETVCNKSLVLVTDDI